MIKQNHAVDHKDVALEAPEGDLVDGDLHETSLYRFVEKLDIKHVNIVQFNIYLLHLAGVLHGDAFLGVHDWVQDANIKKTYSSALYNQCCVEISARYLNSKYHLLTK